MRDTQQAPDLQLWIIIKSIAEGKITIKTRTIVIKSTNNVMNNWYIDY